MALELLTTTAFERDLRRVRKQGKDLDKLEAIVDRLQAQEQLPGAAFIRYAEIGQGIGTATWSPPLQDGAHAHNGFDAEWSKHVPVFTGQHPQIRTGPESAGGA